MMLLTPVHMTVTTGISGSVSFSIKIPGTYGGLQPSTATTGRYFQEAHLWSDSLANGDYVKDLKLTDTDGVVPTAERALLPAYPDVVRFYDAADVDNDNGVYLNSNTPSIIKPFDQDGQPSIRYMPSQLYLTGTFVAGTLAIGRVLRCNIIWGRGVANV